MNTFEMKAGDIFPRLRVTLLDGGGTPMDLTGATVLFRMRERSGNPSISGMASLVGDPSLGVVEYAWRAGETATPGLYRGEWAIDYGTGFQTVPSAGYISIHIEANLEAE